MLFCYYAADLAPLFQILGGWLFLCYYFKKPMSTNQKALIFIPTFNDYHHLFSITTHCQKIIPYADILIIDDGSSIPLPDKTIPKTCRYIKLPDNFGIGFCSHVAFDYALNHHYDCLIRVDADNQHPIDAIPLLLQELTQFDLVAGSRINHKHEHGFKNRLRTLLKTYYSKITSLAAGHQCPSDVNTGFLAFNQSALKCLNRYLFDRYPEPQLFLIASKENLRIKEIFIKQNNRTQGESSLNLWQALKMLYLFHISLLVICIRGPLP